jgi:hypothetical protein
MLPIIIGALGMIAYGMSEKNKKAGTQIKRMAKGGGVDSYISSLSSFKKNFTKLVQESNNNGTKQKLDEYLEGYGIEVEDESDVKRSDWDIFEIEELDDIYQGSKKIVHSKHSKMAKGGHLIGNQSRLDRNKNGKIDSEDLKMIRENKMAKGGKVKDNRGEFGTFVYEIWDNGVMKKEGTVRAGYSNLVKQMAKEMAQNIEHTDIKIRKVK